MVCIDNYYVALIGIELPIDHFCIIAPREKFQSPSSTPKVAQSKNSSLNSTVKRTRSRSSKDDFSLPNVRTLRSLKPADEAKIDLKTESKKSSEGRKTNGIALLEIMISRYLICF